MNPAAAVPVASQTTRPILFLVVLAAAPLWLAASLRPDTFYVGDSGVKLIAARAALATPSHPFDIPLPDIAGVQVAHVEPFFRVHGDHAHAVTSPLFPILTAPLLAAFGLRGLYVLPYLSLIAVAGACAALSATRNGKGATSAAVAILATPFLFYALEYWEHLPAVAAAAVATALLAHGRGLGSGLLIGVAVLLRPEAACFAAALVFASRWLFPALNWADGRRAVLGALLVLVPYELYVFLHFGSLVPPHISANAAAAADRGWAAGRIELAATWFATFGKDSLWTTAPAAAVAAIGFAASARRYSGLMALALGDMLLTLLTMPNAGGGQWGPRYLLFALLPLVIITADTIDRLPRRRTGAVLVAVALVGCFWLQRTAYRELRGTKGIYGGMVDFLSAATADGRPLLTDVWWLDQVAASLFGSRPALYTPAESTGRDLVRWFSDITAPALTIVHAGPVSGEDPAWLNATCYFEEGRMSSPGGELVAFQLRHRCRQ